MGQVTPMRQVQAENAVVRLEQPRVDRQVGRRPRQRLDVYTPPLGVQVKGRQRPLLAQLFRLIDKLVAAIVALDRKSVV